MKLNVLFVSLVMSFMPVSVALAHGEGTEVEVEHGTLETRLQKAKDAAKTKLTALEQTKLENNCQAAQVIVGKNKTKLDSVAKVRGNAYDAMTKKLTTLFTKLENQGIDTTALEAEINVLKTKVTLVKTDIDTYNQTMTDIAGINCKTDPTGFKALLVQARAERQAIVKDAAAIKDYYKTTIKPTLQQMRDAVEADQTNSVGGEE